MRLESATALDALDFRKQDGLVPVIAQHARGGEVLMLGYADRQALARSLAERRMWYYSRSRTALWRKGETSGNTQRLVSLHTDCDADAVLALVEPHGPTCHTGARNCFDALPLLPALDSLIAERATQAPPGSYTARLLADPNLRLKKLGEEAVELALACAGDGNRDVARDRASPNPAAEEAADLLFHALVACRAAAVTLDDVLAALARRRGSATVGPADQDAIDREQRDGAEDGDRE